MSNESDINVAWDAGFDLGYEKGDLDGYERGWSDGYEAGKGIVSKKDKQISDKQPENTFPKHLKTDKEFLDKLQKSKEDCISHIDFDKIYSVMQHLDWKWFTGDDVTVPSIGKLVLFAQRELDCAVKGFLENDCDDYFVSSGGFKASVRGFSDGFCRVTLEFIVSDWDSEIQGNDGGEE
jgi:hypothetical protein